MNHYTVCESGSHDRNKHEEFLAMHLIISIKPKQRKIIVPYNAKKLLFGSVSWSIVVFMKKKKQNL